MLAEEEEDGDLMVKYWATRKHSGVTSSMHTSTSRFDGKKDVKVLTVLATGCTVSVTVSYVIQYSIMLCFTYTYIYYNIYNGKILEDMLFRDSLVFNNWT